MGSAVDTTLHWTDHFVKYGFAVLRNQVPQDYIEKALARVPEHVEGEGRTLPFDQWTTKNVKPAPKVPGDPVLDAIYDQPSIRSIINTMYGTDKVGTPDGWNGKPAYSLFITPFDPDYKPVPLYGGHIDFGGNIIPLFGNAFVIQVCLRDTEPQGGNITIIPGSHRLVQQRAIQNPETQYPYDFLDFPFVEPYEHVARAGDVLLMQHLSFHNGNSCGGATRRPRLALHCQAQRTTFLTKADPADPNNCPWVKSFTLNGFVEDPKDQDRYETFCANKKAMWGYWTSDDGRVQYKLFTWVNGTLQAKISIDGGAEQGVRNARFNGRTLTFEQETEVLQTGRGGSVATAAAPYHAVIEAVPADAERLKVSLRRAGESPVELMLKRTRVVTGRLSG